MPQQDDSRRCNLLTQFCRVMVRDFQLAIPRVLSFVDLEAARLVHGHPISPAGRARVISSAEAMRHTRVKLTVETAVEHQSSADDLDGGGGKMQGVDTCVIWGATADFGPQSGRLDRVRVCAIEAEGAVRSPEGALALVLAGAEEETDIAVALQVQAANGAGVIFVREDQDESLLGASTHHLPSVAEGVEPIEDSLDSLSGGGGGGGGTGSSGRLSLSSVTSAARLSWSGAGAGGASTVERVQIPCLMLSSGMGEKLALLSVRGPCFVASTFGERKAAT